MKQRLQFCIQTRYVFHFVIRLKLLAYFCGNHKKYVDNRHAIFLGFDVFLVLCTICEKCARGCFDLRCVVRNGGHIYSCSWVFLGMTDAGTHRIKIANFCRFCGKTASSKKTSARPKEKFKLEFERHGVDVEECKIGLTSLHDFYGSWHLPFSVRSLDLFCCFTRVYQGHLMLCYKNEF